MTTLIGTAPYQVPTNGDLGTMAFQCSAAISVGLVSVNGNLIVANPATVGVGTTTVAGGNAVAVYGGNLFVAGNIQISNTAVGIGGIVFADGTFLSTATTSTGTGTGNYGNSNVASYLSNSVQIGNLSILNTTPSTSNATGALTVAGGIGVAGNIYVSNAFVSGNLGIGTTVMTSGYVLTVNGGLAATTKSFAIPHPTKANMSLRYASLEGPENGVYFRGKLTGSNKIALPDYWTKLVDVDTITVQLTPIGRHQKLYVVDITNKYIQLGVDSALADAAICCFYTVYAERVDVPKLLVEV